MRYQIPANTLPGARPLYTAHPYIILITALVAGTLPGLVWAAINAHLLGCTDKMRQWVVIGSGYVVIRALSVGSYLNRYVENATSEQIFTADVFRSLSYTGLIALGIYFSDRQQVLFAIHKQNRKGQNFQWPMAIGIIVVSAFLTDLFMPQGSVGKFFWGGFTWGVFK